MKVSTTLVAMTLAVAALAACSSLTTSSPSGDTTVGSNETNTIRPRN